MRRLLPLAKISKGNAINWQAQFSKLLLSTFMLTILAAGGFLVPAVAQARTIAPSTQKIQISGLTMFDQLHGWALGKNNKHVFITNQGPGSWTDVTPALLSQNADTSTVTSSFFLNATHGYIGLLVGANTYLLSTQNGGHTWQTTTFDIPIIADIPAIIQINFIDTQHGWLTFDINQIEPGSFQIRLMRTIDGGKTWQTMLDTNQSPTSLSVPYSLSAHFTFTNAQDGWVTGIYLYGIVYLYNTHDGGKTWSASGITPIKGYQDSDFTLGYGPFWQDSHAGTLLVNYDINDGVSHLMTYKTYDGGKTWIPGPSAPISFNFLSSFPNAQEGWNFGFDGQDHYTILHTSNGGLSWNSFRPSGLIAADAENQVLEDIQFINATTGWLIIQDDQGNLDLFQTHTGGRSWQALQPVVS